MITRVWKGPELEGFGKGVLTLFIEGTFIDGKEVCRFIAENLDCLRVYLGAGGRGITNITNLSHLVSYCKDNNINLVTEIMAYQLNAEITELLKNSHVILTVSGDNCSFIDQFKTDDYKLVKVHDLSNFANTDLSTLSDGLFNVDTLLYKGAGV